MAGQNRDHAIGIIREDSAARKRGKRLVDLLIVAPILLAIVMAAGISMYFLGVLNPVIEAVSGIKIERSAGAKTGADPGGPSAFADLPSVIVNIQDDSGTLRFLRLKANVVLAGEDTGGLIDQRMPLIQDGIQTDLRKLSVPQVIGPKGYERVQRILLDNVRKFAGPLYVRDVSVTELIVQ